MPNATPNLTCDCRFAPAVLGQEARIHDLKSHPPHWQQIAIDHKRADLRRNDRDYRAGDIVHLCEYNPAAVPGSNPCTIIGYTGRCCLRRITHVLPGGQFGLAEGHVALSLKVVYSDDRPFFPWS